MEVIIGSIIGACSVILTTIISIKANKKVKKLQNANTSSQNSKNITMIKVDDFYSELNKSMKKAEFEFIFIAGSMKRLIASYELIKKLSNEKNIQFKFLALNIEKNEIKNAFKKMGKLGTSPALNLNHLRELAKVKNIEIRIYDYLPTAYFFAIDLEKKEKGSIRLINFLHAKEECDYPHIEICYNNEWYEFYKQYILSLWNDSIPLQ